MTRDDAVNTRIRAANVRVIDGDQMLGVLAIREALALARERGLDLVEVDPRGVPPVCKIVDAGKYHYEQRQKQKSNGSARRASGEMKEIRLRPKTDTHDLAVKSRAARRFLEDGFLVKLVVRFRGREITHPEKAQEQLATMLAELKLAGPASPGPALITTPPRIEGRAMIVVVRVA